MDNIAISLFDPQKDYIPNVQSRKALSAWHPSIAILQSPKLPVITSYLLLVPQEHSAAARRLKPIIESSLKATIIRRVKNKTTAKLLLERCTVSLYKIEYDNIWDLASCKRTIEPKLSKINDIKKDKTIILNLCGGTTAERTALYLSLLHVARSSKHIHLKVIRDCTSTTSTAPAHDFIITDPRDEANPTGLISDGIGTLSQSFKSTLDNLESVIVRSKFEKILISGPTGAGKSHLAKIIIAYRQSLDPTTTTANCVSVNIAALTPSLIESELFGYEPGAYTGALKTGKKGIFERANNGIVFLDEIGELPKSLQAKLLTVLDGTPFCRVGGNEPVTSKFMFICGTNKNLLEECRNGDFRNDLLQRISTWHYEIPGLAQRTEDLPLILQRFQGEWRDEFKSEISFDKEARKALLDFAAHAPWPGNFREFNSVFRHLAMLANRKTITLKDVQREILATQQVIPAIQQTSRLNHESIHEDCPYNMIDLAQLACALDVCKTAKSADEAGRILFNARRKESLEHGAKFNGTTYLQRVFTQFGLRTSFKNSTFQVMANPLKTR